MSYQIRIGTHLGPELAAWFAPLAMVNEPNGEATLTGWLADQTALHGVLAKIRDLNLPLLSVQRFNPATGV